MIESYIVGNKESGGSILRYWLWTGLHILRVRLCEAQHREATAGLRDEPRDRGPEVLEAIGFWVEHREEAF